MEHSHKTLDYMMRHPAHSNINMSNQKKDLKTKVNAIYDQEHNLDLVDQHPLEQPIATNTIMPIKLLKH
jgi:homoaconitase/3-isopropylmalate dehydratase large subunit